MCKGLWRWPICVAVRSRVGENKHELRPFIRSSQKVEMGACYTSVSVAATGEMVDMMRNCKRYCFSRRFWMTWFVQPGVTGIILPLKCKYLRGGQQGGAVLSGHLEQLLEAKQ